MNKIVLLFSLCLAMHLTFSQDQKFVGKWYNCAALLGIVYETTESLTVQRTYLWYNRPVFSEDEKEGTWSNIGDTLIVVFGENTMKYFYSEGRLWHFKSDGEINHDASGFARGKGKYGPCRKKKRQRRRLPTTRCRGTLMR